MWPFANSAALRASTKSALQATQSGFASSTETRGIAGCSPAGIWQTAPATAAAGSTAWPTGEGFGVRAFPARPRPAPAAHRIAAWMSIRTASS
jgi:hypothetical protein